MKKPAKEQVGIRLTPQTIKQAQEAIKREPLKYRNFSHFVEIAVVSLLSRIREDV